MATTYSEYSVDPAIEAFFKKTSATRAACDARARDLAGENVVPVDVQGFRLESLALKTEITSLATDIHGPLTPKVSFEGKVEAGEKEPPHVYLMSRMRGMAHLEFILTHGFPEKSPDNFAGRKNLIRDVAQDLRLLYNALPSGFRPIVQTCIDSIDDILSLPMVFLHRDFGSCNIMVDEATCHLVGVIDWAEAEEVFWDRSKREVGGLSDDQLRTIKLARILGLLLSRGFASRLVNKLVPVPNGDDEPGRYKTMSLDGFLINPQTKFNGFE